MAVINFRESEEVDRKTNAAPRRLAFSSMELVSVGSHPGICAVWSAYLLIGNISLRNSFNSYDKIEQIISLVLIVTSMSIIDASGKKWFNCHFNMLIIQQGSIISSSEVVRQYCNT